MKKKVLIGLLALTLGVAAKASSFDYASTTQTGITFNGTGNFSFSPSSDNFKVTDGTAAGDLGEITGTYTIGAITTTAGVSTANVTGNGQFIIHDGAGHDFTANLVWDDIFQFGSGGGLNTAGSANLTGITYTGSNADLLALALRGTANNVLTFQFSPPESLTILASGGSSLSTSFSGTVSVPDGGTTVALLGCALVGMATLRRTMSFKAVKA